MIRHARLSTRTCNTLLLTGAVLAALTAGCSSSSSGNPSLPDASLPKLDTAPAMLPDASLPKLDTAPALLPDAIPPNLDTAPAQVPDALPPPQLDTNPPDVPADLPPATGGAGGKDGGTGGTGGTAGVDGSADRPSPGPDAGDAAGDGGSEDGGDGGFVCATPKAAWGYDLSLLVDIAWDKDGSLITAATYFPLVSPRVFGSKPVTSYGSADMLVAKIDPSTGNASWVVTVGDELDQTVTSAAVSSAGPGVIGTFTGTVDVFNGTQPTKVIVNSAPAPIDYIAGLSDADGSGMWAKKVNLGTGGLNAIAAHPGKDFFVVCGAATNNAANLAVAGTTTPPGAPGGGTDVVVAAIKDGNVLWSHLFGGLGNQTCTAATLDDDGNAIFAGSYAGALDFGTGALSPAPTGAQDAILWVAKLNGTTGATMAAKAFGTTGQVQPSALTSDSQRNVIVAGLLFVPATFGSQTLTPLGQSDVFVAKLDSSLAPSWARRWGGASGQDAPGPGGMAVDSNGNVTVVGNFRGTIDVGPGNTILTSNGTQPTNMNPFVVSLDGATGQTLCAHAYGDASLKGGNAAAVAVNRRATGANQDATAIVGYFLPGIDFGRPTTPLVTPAAMLTGGSGFLLRM